jgi:hypothetical protein
MARTYATILVTLVVLLTSTVAIAQTPGRAWTPTDRLGTKRFAHTATRLPSGDVLVTGGNSDFFHRTPQPLASVEIYRHAAARWDPGPPMHTARYDHEAVLLDDGRVIVAGGVSIPQFGYVEFLTSAEIYDPATGSWSTTGSMAVGRFDHAMARLADGRVLVAGGETSGGRTASAEIYDPATRQWTPVASMAEARIRFTATRLADGTVLVAGGSFEQEASTTEVFDPATGSWTTGPSMLAMRFDHSAVLLETGEVLVIGGAEPSVPNVVELYDPVSKHWTQIPGPAYPRSSARAALLDDGRVLDAGGGQNQVVQGAAEIFDPATSRWRVTGSLADPREFHTLTPLPGGGAVAAGGLGAGVYATAEAWDPTSPEQSFPPLLTRSRTTFGEKWWRKKIFGDHFQPGIRVVYYDELIWPHVTRQSRTRLVIGRSNALAELFAADGASPVRLVNPDGSQTIFSARGF